VLAHVVGTLDRIAEGRVILGVGIAADTPAIRKEFEAASVPFERRVGRFLEILEICQALWSRDGVSFSGKHFTLQDVTVEPKPHRSGGPPIWIGGSGPTALREAARFDAWFPTGPSVEFFAERFPAVQAAARAAGRASSAVTGAAYVTLALDANRAAAEQRLASFLETYYAAPAQAIMKRQATYAGPIEGCVEWLQRWIDAGARHLALRFAGGDQLAQVDETAAKVLPRLTRR
jgi:alkanesulfonate monooxygenase SsuD/methylene tetrahydromethanopterin reductase-like flavin-dependent oxidoreductase (luciferase family)